MPPEKHTKKPGKRKRRSRAPSPVDTHYTPTTGTKQSRTADSVQTLRRSARLNKSFPFFKLPPELRDLVYDEIWMADPVILFRPIPNIPGDSGQYLKYRDAVRYTKEKANPIKEGFPLWLLTNKQFLKEGLDQLCHKGNWQINATADQRIPPLIISRFPHTLSVRILYFQLPSPDPLPSYLGAWSSFRNIIGNPLVVSNITKLKLKLQLQHPRVYAGTEKLTFSLSYYYDLVSCFKNIETLRISADVLFFEGSTSEAQLDVFFKQQDNVINALVSRCREGDKRTSIRVRRKRDRRQHPPSRLVTAPTTYKYMWPATLVEDSE